MNNLTPAGPAPPFSPRGEEKDFEVGTKSGGEREGQTSQNGQNGHSGVVNGTTNGTNGEQANGNSSIKPDDVANRKETPTASSLMKTTTVVQKNYC